ncbi:MAG: hypothetical protein GF349_03790 [Candidatus Magasanikbacteria bacterium]|nr:hypothetical protein [Candidatus Magasanikbacteria bacterium]
MKKILYLFGIFSFVLILTGQGCVSLSGNNESGSGPAGIFVTADRGDSWRQISLLPTAEGVEQLSNVSVYRMFNDPQDSKTIYWASRQNGLYYTYDEGKTWQHSVAPLDKGFIYSVAVHPADQCNVYATNGFRVFKTENCNRSWVEVHREERERARVTSIAINQFSPYQVFITKANGEILRSNDSGDSWTVVARVKNGDFAEIKASPLEKDLLYVASKDEGLFRTEDAGDTWQSLEESFDDFAESLEFRRFELHSSSTSTLYWISTYGILKSEDAGNSWQPFELITPPGSADIYGFAVNPNNEDEIFYTATIKGKSIFYRSNDGGVSWTTKKLPSGQVPTYLRIHPEKDNIIYLGFTILPSN